LFCIASFSNWLLVAGVVDKGSDTGNGYATGSECKGIYYKGNTGKSETYEDDRVKKVSHFAILAVK
jgi:hypothetical protein